jgi:large subunit ribosomal protein L15
VEYSVVNVETLAQAFDRGEVDPAAMLSRGLIHGGRPVKVLARGDLGRALIVKAHAFSRAAKAKIEAAGGRIEIVT